MIVRISANTIGSNTRRAFMVLAAGALVMSAPASARALTIVPTFNANLSLSSIATINQAIAFYQNTFSDPITVSIAFTNTDQGLGSNESWTANASYSLIRNAMLGDRTSADDFAATPNYAPGANDPILGHSTMNIKTANARAIGLSVFGNAFGGDCSDNIVDGCVSLNLAITTDVNPHGYSLIGVVEHEIDEVLGLGSSLSAPDDQNPNGSIFQNSISPEDLFRYASSGVRSFALNTSCSNPPSASFSINGTTMLDGFNNCNNGGDYGDWTTNSPPQVQDAFGTADAGQSLTSVNDQEVRALDVVGYTLNTQAAPEPASLTLFGTGLAGLAIGYRRRKRKS